MSENTMPSSTLSPFAPGDEAALVETWFSSWLSVGLALPVVTRADLADRLPHDLAVGWDVTVAASNGVILGFLAVVLDEQRLDQLFIAPDAQGQGIGRRLFEVAKQKMAYGFWLSKQPENTRARAFYQRAGMQFSHAETDSWGDDDRIICKFDR